MRASNPSLLIPRTGLHISDGFSFSQCKSQRKVSCHDIYTRRSIRRYGGAPSREWKRTKYLIKPNIFRFQVTISHLSLNFRYNKYVFPGGSGDDIIYGPDFLVEQDVILVTFNYRLNIFGFLSFDSDEYSGNMGLKDQQLAIQWVHSNIDGFSGDNQRITVFGHSAGGASTHFQTLSSESRKYFRNAIIMSGSAENYWTYSSHSSHLDLTIEMASDLGEEHPPFDRLVELLQSAPADELTEYGSVSNLVSRTFSLMYAPLIERKWKWQSHHLFAMIACTQ